LSVERKEAREISKDLHKISKESNSKTLHQVVMSGTYSNKRVEKKKALAQEGNLSKHALKRKSTPTPRGMQMPPCPRRTSVRTWTGARAANKVCLREGSTEHSQRGDHTRVKGDADRGQCGNHQQDNSRRRPMKKNLLRRP